MSPEQAKGRAVDRRSDVWAFGCVLYEMFTGQRAFPGEDVSDTLAAVLRAEPDWSTLPSTLSPTLRLYLQRCLHKDPRQRIPDIAAMRLALAGAFDAPAAPLGAATGSTLIRPRWRRALPWIAAVLVVVVAGFAAATSVSRRPTAPPRVARFVINTPPDLPFQIVGPSAIAISPDGSRLLYRLHRGTSGPDNGVLYVRQLGQVDATPIRGTEGALAASFSPDGEWVAFNSSKDRMLKRIRVSGGPAEPICPLEYALAHITWGSDGTIVFSLGAGGLRRAPATGGEPQVLTTVTGDDLEHRSPEVLPNGKTVLFTALSAQSRRSRILAVSIASGKVVELVRDGSSSRFSPTGHLVYAVDGELLAVPFDPDRLEVKGPPSPVLQGLSTNNYALAADGSLLYVKGSAIQAVPRTLVWIDRQGREEPVNIPPRSYVYARLSPDGTRVALDARDAQNDIWIWDFTRESLIRLTNDPNMKRGPIWTPDGSRIAFNVIRAGEPEGIYWQKADGSGPAERLAKESSARRGTFPSSFTADGTRLIAHPSSDPRDISLIALDGERGETILRGSQFNEMNGVVSPDSKWLAYESDESGVREVYVVPFPDAATSKEKISLQGGRMPLWSRDGRELFYHTGSDTIMAVPITRGAKLTPGKPVVAVKGANAPGVFGRFYDVSPDGKRFLILKDVKEKDAMKPPAPEIHLVQNWAEELKRLVPVNR